MLSTCKEVYRTVFSSILITFGDDVKEVALGIALELSGQLILNKLTFFVKSLEYPTQEEQS